MTRFARAEKTGDAIEHALVVHHGTPAPHPPRPTAVGASTPWSSDMDGILVGPVPDHLRSLPGQAFHACITSLPAYGQRELHAPTYAWNTNPACTHHTQPRVRGTCARCGGWQGPLGLEPRIEDYARHVRILLSPVLATLRREGSLWLHVPPPTRPGVHATTASASLARDLMGALEGELQRGGWCLQARVKAGSGHLLVLCPTHREPRELQRLLRLVGHHGEGNVEVEVLGFTTELAALCLQAATDSPWCCTNCGTPQPPHRRKRRCTCQAPLHPCLVLDPFFRSGILGAAAIQVGWHFLGITATTAQARTARRRLDPILHQFLHGGCNP